MSDFGMFYEKPYRPLETLTEEEAKHELEQWRNLYTWLDDTVKYWLTKVGEDIRISLRNGQAYRGRLGAVEYEEKVLRVSVVERTYDYTQGLARYETKDVLVKISDVVGWQFIYNEEVKEEDSAGNPPVAVSDVRDEFQ